MYRSLFSLGLMAVALVLSAQSYVHRVLILNEGYYDPSNGGGQVVPVSLGSYDLSTDTYQEVAIFEGPRFASDILVAGSFVFVAADDRVMRLDADTYQQTGECLVQGVRKLAVWNDRLLLTRGEVGGLSHYFEMRDLNTLELIQQWGPGDGLMHSAEDVLVLDDKAYLAVGNAFDWSDLVGQVAIIDLQSGNYEGHVDLGPDGTNPERLMVHEGDIIAFNNTDFSRSTVSRVSPANESLLYTATVSQNSGCAASVHVASSGKLYFMEYAQGELARFDLEMGAVTDTLAGSPAVYGLLDDPINGVLYATTTDFFSSGELHILDLDGQVQSSVAVGVSPGNLALDVRSVTGLDEIWVSPMQAYPVPAADQIYLTGVRTHVPIRVLDAAGRTVLTMGPVTTAGRLTVDISGLSVGVYHVVAEGAGPVRFVKH